MLMLSTSSSTWHLYALTNFSWFYHRFYFKVKNRLKFTLFLSKMVDHEEECLPLHALRPWYIWLGSNNSINWPNHVLHESWGALLSYFIHCHVRISKIFESHSSIKGLIRQSRHGRLCLGRLEQHCMSGVFDSDSIVLDKVFLCFDL